MRFILITICFLNLDSVAQTNIRVINVDSGWANNSVNVAVFRKNSLVTYGDTQFIAYYGKDAFVMVGKRNIKDTNWQLQHTPFKGNAADAHNIISIMADGEGYLHIAWDHHNNALHYSKSVAPGSLIFTDTLFMTGLNESKVTYPEFYNLQSGNLIFLYRDGGSGNGNLIVNKYDVQLKKWTQVQSNFIDGEGKRNAYWQACTDDKGTIHISWVWRESPDVASNHDMCYARSGDGGITWERSTGEKYNLPVTQATAEYIAYIPQQSELINQTSMYADENGNPYIGTYWKDSNDIAPQYHLIYIKNGKWITRNTGFRKTDFSLSGIGTKRIPVARPQVICWQHKSKKYIVIIFRDEERDNKISVAVSKDKAKRKWKIIDLTQNNMGSWEPTYDSEIWKRKKQLHLFVQKVEQADAEGITNVPSQMVQVLEWIP